MTHFILKRPVGMMALAAAALVSFSSQASADHYTTAITKQMTCRIRAANEQLNRDVRAVNLWYRDALEQARCEVKAARRNACPSERRFIEQAYQARLAEIRCAYKEKLRAVRFQAEAERTAARREFELARQQARFDRGYGAGGGGFIHGHPDDCGCDRCRAAGADCASGFCPAPFAPSVEPRNYVPQNRLPPFAAPHSDHRFTPPTDPRLIQPTPGARYDRPTNDVRFNQQAPYLAMLQMLMNR